MHAAALRVVLIGFLLNIGCKRPKEPGASPAGPASTSNALDIPGCGASIAAPPESRTLSQRDGLQLAVAESAIVDAACLLKRESGPQSLAHYVASVTDELSKQGRRAEFRPLDTSALERVLGRPVLGVDAIPTDPSEPRTS